jgi:PAS domain S-box-containing protein
MSSRTQSHAGAPALHRSVAGLQKYQVYAFGLAAVTAATTLCQLCHRTLGISALYIFYILPIIATATYGGLAAGLFTTISSAMALAIAFLGVRVFILPDGAYFVAFLLDGLYISWLGQRMSLAMRAAAKSADAAEIAREREATILKSVSDAFGSVDEDWQFVHANDRLATLTGLPLGELLGKEAWEAWPELGEGPARRELERARREQSPVRVEIFMPRLGLWYETSAYPHAHGLSLFSRDITDRKRAEEIQREAEERLRLAPEAARIGIWTYDLTTHRIAFSSELEQIFGVMPESFAGTARAVFRLIHREDRPKVREAIRLAIEQCSTYETHFRYLLRTGETRWMLSRGKLCTDSDGLPCRVVGAGLDITEQKQSEEKLRHTQKLESLGVLAGGIAHDFNNLLVGIMGNAALASESLAAGHDVHEQLDEIILAGRKAADLTRQMLAYAGKGKVVLERVDLSKLILDTERLLRTSLLKKVNLQLDLEVDLPCVDADAGQMQQVVMNLVINAAEATADEQSGGVSLRTRRQYIDTEFTRSQLAGQEVPPGNYVVLEVQDRGVGMDEATQARIFEPFFTTKFLGRGLGLSAVLGIVRGHKGGLRVTSSPGKGTMFQVLLPAASECRTISDFPSAELKLQGNGTVLVVDDENGVRKFAQSALAKYGYTTLVAEDAFAALNLLRQTRHRIAVVLLDLSMPGMKAQQAVERIQSGWPGTPILLSSGYGEEEVLTQFAGTKNLRFLPKPYTPMQLAEKIKAAISTVEIGNHAPERIAPARHEDVMVGRSTSIFAA